MKFAHKSGIVWEIYLIKLYICSANYPSIIFWIATLRITITIEKGMDIFDKMCIYIIT